MQEIRHSRLCPYLDLHNIYSVPYIGPAERVAKAHSSFLGALCLAMRELQIESPEERIEEQILWRRYLASEFVDGTLYVVLGYAPGSDLVASTPACCVPCEAQSKPRGSAV